MKRLILILLFSATCTLATSQIATTYIGFTKDYIGNKWEFEHPGYYKFESKPDYITFYNKQYDIAIQFIFDLDNPDQKVKQVYTMYSSEDIARRAFNDYLLNGWIQITPVLAYNPRDREGITLEATTQRGLHIVSNFLYPL